MASAVLALTLPALRNQFVNLDDRLYLGNPAVASGLTARGVLFALTSVTDLYWHPIAWISHETDVQLFGMNPLGHHLTSALLHAVSAALLFLLLKRLGAGTLASAAGSLFWALHPLRVESFAWIAERKDVLCAAFFLAALLAYVHHADRPSRRRFLTWNALGALALMSKPPAVCLVPMLVLLDWWPLRRKRFLVEKIPLIAITAIVMFLTVCGQKQSGSMSHLAGVPFGIRVANVPIFYLRYIGKIFWPLHLACFYGYDPSPAALRVVAASLGVIGVTLGAFRCRRRWPWAWIAWIWFLVALLPNIGVLQAGRQSIADRFTHLATIGLAVGVALSLRGRVATGATFAVIVALACLTVRQIGFWHDSIALFEHAIEVEDSDYVRGDLASTLMSERRYAEAEPHLRLAVRRSPTVAEYRSNLANLLLRTERLNEASHEAAIALRLAPNSIPASETTALILFRQGDSRGTLEHFNHAVELGAPRGPVGIELSDMGASLASRGRVEEAEPLIRRALELNPRLVQGWRNLALVLSDQGRFEDARKVIQQAIAVTGAQAAYADLTPPPPEENR